MFKRTVHFDVEPRTSAVATGVATHSYSWAWAGAEAATRDSVARPIQVFAAWAAGTAHPSQRLAVVAF